MTLRNLDTILKLKRNLPKAKRLLQTRQYRRLFKVHCPRLLKYKSSKSLAFAVTNHIMEQITERMKDKDIVALIYKELRKLPLRMGLKKGTGTTTRKVKWHHVRIEDTYIREQLQRQLQRAHYTASINKTRLLIRTV